MAEKILSVDDEREMADLLEVCLTSDGHEVEKFYRGKPALESMANNQFDLAVLDVILPDIDSFQMVKRAREKYFFPIILLTAKIEDIDKITGLTLDADDYIIEPFNPLEIVARIRTQLRRLRKYNSQASL